MSAAVSRLFLRSLRVNKKYECDTLLMTARAVDAFETQKVEKTKGGNGCIGNVMGKDENWKMFSFLFFWVGHHRTQPDSKRTHAHSNF